MLRWAVRIVRLANFVTPHSGGLRTALAELGREYAAAGHEPLLITPGSSGLRGIPVPGTGGYRVLLGRRRLTRLLDELTPDVLEVSDRTTLRWTGKWARSRGIPTVMVSHESLAGLLGFLPLPRRRRDGLADRLNARTARDFDVIVGTTSWAGAEFRRIGVDNLLRVPLGVDLTTFHPCRYSPALRSLLASPDQRLLVHCGRLSVEKRVDRSIEALRSLRSDGLDATLVLAGDGPLRRSLERRAAGLPIRFLGHIRDRYELAALLATADAVIAPGPVETFGLAALEALASGTPVVCDAASALPEVIGPAGAAVRGPAASAFAQGVRAVHARPDRREAARRRAEEFSWAASAAGFLAAHAEAARLRRSFSVPA